VFNDFFECFLTFKHSILFWRKSIIIVVCVIDLFIFDIYRMLLNRIIDYR